MRPTRALLQQSLRTFLTTVSTGGYWMRTASSEFFFRLKPHLTALSSYAAGWCSNASCTLMEALPSRETMVKHTSQLISICKRWANDTRSRFHRDTRSGVIGPPLAERDKLRGMLHHRSARGGPMTPDLVSRWKRDRVSLAHL